MCSTGFGTITNYSTVFLTITKKVQYICCYKYKLCSVQFLVKFEIMLSTDFGKITYDGPVNFGMQQCCD